MTRRIDRIAEVASDYDAIVFDQWGVLHNGSTPYSGALDCIDDLVAAGHRLAVLSNSGKRAANNARRITSMGFRPDGFDVVMTSGEALWHDIQAAQISERRFFAVQRSPDDAASWAGGLDIELTGFETADAILLMGLPDGTELDAWQSVIADALARKLPIYCSNPDRKSPRAGGTVVSPGALAFRYQDMGGRVTFYGKPHLPVFRSLQSALEAKKILMIGDSLEHDIAGAATAGWDSVLVGGGLYAEAFAQGPWQDALATLSKGTAPTFYIGEIR